MKVLNSIATVQRLSKRWQREGLKIGFVPTMGYLHAGHLSLVHEARRRVGRRGRVVVSIFVNPTQFGPKEDLGKYPRDLAGDLRLCRQAGVDAVFAPPNAEMYPADERAPFSTFVVEESLSKGMEGASRPTHFRGVTTVVAKLFNIVRPDVAVFGAKDFQQAAIVKRMVRDLDFPVQVVVAPTIRESDGLALSSRNKYLQGDLRAQAVALWAAIQLAKSTVRNTTRAVPAANLRRRLRTQIEAQPAARLDYIEFFEPDTLQPVEMVIRGVQMALAVFVGSTRLIDNATL